MSEQQDTQAFTTSLSQSNLTALRIQAICGALGQPFFAALDYFTMPSNHLPLFFGMRGFCVLCYFIAIGLSFTKQMHHYANLMGSYLAWITGWAIVVMVYYDNGPTSIYYAGLNIPILATGLLFTWSWRWNLLMALPIYLAYLGPNLMDPNLGNHIPVFVANNFFIVFTIAYLTIAQHFNMLRRKEVFFANLALDRAKSELEHANDRLKELDRVKNQFFANITHELRTPLTLILTPVDAIIQGELGHFKHHQMTYFQTIRENGLRLLKLINDLLELTKLRDSKIRIRLEKVKIGPFIQKLLGTAQGLAERKRINIVFNCGDHALWFDPTQMERILLNVLANALKFTPIGGNIWVDVIEMQGSIAISVKDTGIGIPEEHLPHIFDRFFQSDSSSTRQFGGTGIGLALAKELVLLHEGTIEAESELDKGTTVTITLQKGKDHFRGEVLDRRQRSEEQEKSRRMDDSGVAVWTHQLVDQESFRFIELDQVTERRAVPRQEHQFKEARLLIVEDNLELLRFLNTLLGETYDIYTATDGQTALEQAKLRKPDLILSDVMIPIMDGFELCEKVKTDPETMHIPVIMLTARGKVEDRITGLEQGADAYISKPFSPKELRTIVRETLKSRAKTAKVVLRKRLDAVQLMSARMAHEIYNPLNMVQNSIVGMKRKLDKRNDEETLELLGPFFNIAERAIPRIHQTVELMKQYSREGYAKNVSPNYPKDTIKQLLKVVSVPQDVECNFEVNIESNKAVWCDPAEFNQALINVLENAVDAIEAKGTVRVHVFEEEEQVIFSIQDDGCGISPDDLDRIFSPFFTTKGPNKGMGLGMTITLQTIEAQGGEMAIKSEVGVGTQVLIRMPQRHPIGPNEEAPLVG
ncbi:MAG: response regulator [Deltaproteobacteria bacterium]|nr:MAG: response regulator [Deltaproteobacteria bacterium]